MEPYEPATNRFNTLDQLDQVCMRPGERRTAKAYFRQAELLADTLRSVDAELRRVLGCAGNGIGALARRSRARAVTAAPH